jgi:hypothetical protein
MRQASASFYEAARIVALNSLGKFPSGASVRNVPSMSPKKAKKILRRGTAIDPPKITAADAETALLPRLAGSYAAYHFCSGKIDAELSAAIAVESAGIIGTLAGSLGTDEAMKIVAGIDQRAQDIVANGWPAIVSIANALFDRGDLAASEIQQILNERAVL